MRGTSFWAMMKVLLTPSCCRTMERICIAFSGSHLTSDMLAIRTEAAEKKVIEIQFSLLWKSCSDSDLIMHSVGYTAKAKAQKHVMVGLSFMMLKVCMSICDNQNDTGSWVRGQNNW